MSKSSDSGIFLLQNNLYKFTRYYDNQRVRDSFKIAKPAVFLFGDNDSDFLRQSGRRTTFGGQARCFRQDEARFLDGEFMFGIITTWYGTAQPSDEKWKRVLDLQFGVLRDFIKNGGKVVYPSDPRDPRNRDGNFVSLGTGIAKISPAMHTYITQKTLELQEIRPLRIRGGDLAMAGFKRQAEEVRDEISLLLQQKEALPIANPKSAASGRPDSRGLRQEWRPATVADASFAPAPATSYDPRRPEDATQFQTFIPEAAPAPQQRTPVQAFASGAARAPLVSPRTTTHGSLQELSAIKQYGIGFNNCLAAALESQQISKDEFLRPAKYCGFGVKSRMTEQDGFITIIIDEIIPNSLAQTVFKVGDVLTSKTNLSKIDAITQLRNLELGNFEIERDGEIIDIEASNKQPSFIKNQKAVSFEEFRNQQATHVK